MAALNIQVFPQEAWHKPAGIVLDEEAAKVLYEVIGRLLVQMREPAPGLMHYGAELNAMAPDGEAYRFRLAIIAPEGMRGGLPFDSFATPYGDRDICGAPQGETPESIMTGVEKFRRFDDL